MHDHEIIRSWMTSRPHRLKKTSSMQSKRRDLHHTRLHRETNEKLSFHCSKTCLSISSNLIGYFKQALKSNRLLRLSKAFPWAEKKMGFSAKNTMICEYMALLRASQIA